MASYAVKTENEKFCMECGDLIRKAAEICPKCGVRQLGSSGSMGGIAPNGKSRVTAALLAFFLGGVGAHKFYLGQPAMGLLYLFFFWTFLPALASIIELILLLTMTDEAFIAKYGH